MKILLLSIEFPPGPGGMGTLAYQIAYRLSLAGWEATAVTPQNYADEDEIASFANDQPFSIHRVTYEGPFLFEAVNRFIQAFKMIRRQDIAIILSVSEQAVWLGAVLALCMRRPFVAVGVGTEFARGGRIRHWLTRWAFNRAQRQIAISQYTQGLMRQIGMAMDNAEIVLCGADSDVYQAGLPVAELRQRLQLGDGPIILTVGQVSARKAQDIVIRALPHIRQSCPNVKYLIAGLPTHQQSMEALARELGVVDHVVFLGRAAREELPALYNLADLFVLVSRQTSTGDVEGYGIVVTEAALCGVTAVVSNHSGLVETVIDGVTGLIVEPEDPEATGKAIARLLGDDALRNRMGQAARQHAIEAATWEKRISVYDKILRQVLTEAK